MLALSNMISYLATRARCVRGDGTQTRQPQQQLQKRGNSRPVRLAWFCHGAHKRQELSNTWKQPPTEHIIKQRQVPCCPFSENVFQATAFGSPERKLPVLTLCLHGAISPSQGEHRCLHRLGCPEGFHGCHSSGGAADRLDPNKWHSSKEEKASRFPET